MQVAYSLSLHLKDAKSKSAYNSIFSPAQSFAWAHGVKDSSGEPIPWERFWAADSPFLLDGRARLVLRLNVPRS